MNIYIFLSALRARSGVFALVLTVTVLSAIAVSLLLPKTYTATMSLLLDSKQEQSLSNLQPLIPPQERISYLQTQADIITSQRVARKVVQDLKLADSPSLRADFAKTAANGGVIEDWLAENLRAQLKVKTSQSSIINITYSAADPQFSALVANAFGKAYIDTVLELRVEPAREAATWFEEQLRSLRANLQAKLAEYHSQQARDVLGRRLPSDSAAGSRDNFGRDDPLIQKLQADLVTGEAKLQELTTRYGPNHPAYKGQLSENQSLREKLDAEMSKAATRLDSSARQSRLREAGLTAALAAQRARLLELKENRYELTVLKRDVESAERAYDTAMQRFVVSQVESRANQTNVTVLNPAVVPSKPSSPKIALNVALSLVVGTILGIGIVLLMEMKNRRVRSRDDLNNEFNVPIIAVLSAWRPAGTPLLGRLGGGARALPNLD
jgi:uncharacterized protein involved in exopolysaccharide biosynthesis